MKRLLFTAPILFTLVLTVSGQCEIDDQRPFKIALAQTVNSATARPSDYVQFTTLEDIYAKNPPSTGTCSQVLIPKGTSVFGFVIDGKHRHFPFVNGRLEVKLQPLIIWNGHSLTVSIDRRREPIEGQKPPKLCRREKENCLAGRKNGATAPIVTGIAAAGAAAIAAAASKDTTRIIAATGLFTILAQSDVAQILNGTDAELDEKEVFDMRFAAHTSMDPVPAPPKGN